MKALIPKSIVWVILLGMLLSPGLLAQIPSPVLPAPGYDSNLYFMFWWEHVSDYTAAQLANEAAYMAQNIGSGPYIQTGFSLEFNFGPGTYTFPVNQASIDSQVASKMSYLDGILAKARQAGIKIHLHMFSYFYQGSYSGITVQIVQADQRNAQWYYSAPGAPPNLALSHYSNNSTYWPTMSRYALQWMEFKERYFTALGAGLAQRLHNYGDVLISLDGDAEVQLSDSKINCSGCSNASVYYDQYADYSPYAVAEFRDWAAHRGEYCDSCSGKYAGQGRPGIPPIGNNLAAFNSYYQTSFSTWELQNGDTAYYFGSGTPPVIAGGFAAPTYPAPGQVHTHQMKLPTSPPLLGAWMEFRELMVKNSLKDTMKWVSSGVYNPPVTAESEPTSAINGVTRADLSSAVTIPADRYYASQIAGDHLGQGTPAQPLVRYLVSGSGMSTGDVRPIGSPGWTGFSYTDAWFIYRTQDQEFFDRLDSMDPLNWGLFEYNPYYPHVAVPPAYGPFWPNWPHESTLECITSEIGHIRSYLPHILVPFVYTNISGADSMNFKDISSGGLTRLGQGVAAFIGNSANKYTPRQYLPGASFMPPKVHGITGTGLGGQVNLRIAPNIFPGNNVFLWSEWPQLRWFEVYRSSNQNLSDELNIGRAYLGSNPIAYQDSSLTVPGYYYYRVRAVNILNEMGGYSDAVAVEMCSSQLGDLNGDHQINGADADIALRHYLGLIQPTSCTNATGNVYQSATTGITPRDALNILKNILN